jgi:L-alanine-DL-glutamate epimerase-like enolase superfamily enzyme
MRSGSNVRITDIEVLHLRAPTDDPDAFDGSYDDVVVLITTDSGHVGIGEAESLAPAVRAVIEGPGAHRHARSLAEVLIGTDPRDPVARWREMYDATSMIGRRGLVLHAIGAIDLALWDLAGQAAGEPVSTLLGRPRRDRVPVYGSIYPLPRTAEGVRERIEAARALNIRAFKLCADPWWLDDLAETAGLLAAAREAAGDEATLIVDAALAYERAEEGLALLPLLREIDVAFLEAPLPLDDLAGHAAMKGNGVLLGIGDLGLTHLAEFVELTERGAGDVWQPDVTCVGGLSGILPIADEADRRGLPLVPHGYKTSITVAANAHLLATRPDEPLMEYSLSPSPLRWRTTRERLDVLPDGTVAVPTRPGLGVSLDPEIRRYAVN